MLKIRTGEERVVMAGPRRALGFLERLIAPGLERVLTEQEALARRMEERFNALDKRIDDLQRNTNTQLQDVKSMLGRLDDRLFALAQQRQPQPQRPKPPPEPERGGDRDR